MKSNIKSKYRGVIQYVALILLLVLAGVAFFTYFPSGANLPYADAISRLNITRKVVDNITPGLAQLGSVWLPLPHILMLPFIWNDYMWRSGLAGSIMSMTAFIIGGIYIFRTAFILSKSYLTSFAVLSIYALNINVLYLQTTAMSESLFMTTLAIATYYFVLWFQTFNYLHLILAALAVSAMTLTRYEGLSVLLASIPMVAFYIFIRSKKKKFRQAEGKTLLYVVLASLGFSLWTLYLTTIFGDPLFWINYYASEQTSTSGAKVYTQAKPLMEAVWQYFTSVTWMAGIVPMLFAGIGLFGLAIKTIKDRNWLFLPVLLPSAIFMFMVLTLMRNTPIVQPDLSVNNIISTETSMDVGFNIRYGLLILPWIAVLATYAFPRRRILAIPLITIFSFGMAFQIYTYFRPAPTLVYKIPDRIGTQEVKPFQDMVNYIKAHRKEGEYILVSAAGNEDQMFLMGYDYDVFIHEGVNKYWKETIDFPPLYADWIIINYGQVADRLQRKFPRNHPTLLREYDRVYDKEQVAIYKIKHPPYREIED